MHNSPALARLRIRKDTGPRITDDMLALSGLPRINIAKMRPEPLGQLAEPGDLSPRSIMCKTNASIQVALSMTAWEINAKLLDVNVPGVSLLESNADIVGGG